MPELPTVLTPRLPAALGLALLALTLFAACDNGNDSTPATDTPAATAEGTAPDSADSLKLPVETGADPVYWRSEDGFQSVVAGQPYKLVLRVTNGYEEETLLIEAEPEGDGTGVSFEATRALPVGPEDPGSFYVFNLELPEPGAWRVTALAGDDAVTITVQARPASPVTRY